MKKLFKPLIMLLAILILFSGCNEYEEFITLSDIPEYATEPYVAINGNVPFFTEAEYTKESFEEYSELDSLGRCGVAFACIGTDIMPTEEREGIGQVKPSGWYTVKYDFVDGKYLYNRCHLIGFQLAGENANEKNLITGTRYLNVTGMLPFENMVADYVKETNNHVLYRVTPVYNEDDLVCRGVIMEALSMEDNGAGISFNVYCYNVQPGVKINYATGESELDGSYKETESSKPQEEKENFIVNVNTKKIHRMNCKHVVEISEKNMQFYNEYLSTLEESGYVKCKECF